MVAAYYSRGCDSEALFEKYEIARMEDYQTHRNQYNVIQLDVAEMRVIKPKKENVVGYLQKCVLDELRSAKAVKRKIQQNMTQQRRPPSVKYISDGGFVSI